MPMLYSKEHLCPSQARLQRVLEIIPGATSWTILIGLTLLSIFSPFAAAIIIVAFYLWWLLRLLYMTLFLVLSYIRLDMEKKTDWMAKVRATKEMDAADIYHLVIFPIVKEGPDIIEPAVQALCQQQFPTRQMVVVFALEERAEEHIKQGVITVEKKYKDRFWACFTAVHPEGLPHEAKVKGANVTYAARQATRFFEERKLPLEHIIVSCFDADTVVSPDYFACLTYHFMTHPKRQRASFQPIPVYHNNIWNVPGFARVLETGSSFFQLIEATNPEKLVTFSSHSMSFKALVDVGYWPVDMISDDSAIFWKCYIHYDGDYQVVPMYVTLSMDVACADTWWRTVQSVYKQKRRWAWGVENFPLVIRAFLQPNKIPFYQKLRQAFKLYEGHMSWATWGIILSVIGWLPIIFARKEFAASVVYYNVPDIADTIFHLGSLCLGISIILSLALLPKTKVRHSWLLKCGHALEWLLVPVILLFLGSLPALDAQTRLMFGRYLEFWVTDKKRPRTTLGTGSGQK